MSEGGAAGGPWQGEAADLPFDDATFDLVLSVHDLEHVPEPDLDQAIQELARVTKNHAFVLISTCGVCPGGTDPPRGNGPAPTRVDVVTRPDDDKARR
eukprot:1191024-Prorocentrum_minimum.AAC.2